MNLMLVGFGAIGQGFCRVLSSKHGELKKRYGIDLRVVSISDITGTLVGPKGIDLKKALDVAADGKGIIKHQHAKKAGAVEAIESVEADLMVEATPSNIETGEPGLTHMLKAMDAGMHVVTSNKGPLALDFRKLRETAERNNVNFKFEASVGGAMPIINLATRSLSADRVSAIEGILNGTTNFILTRMLKEGSPLEIVLREAQELGIAETDPTYDIDGIDTASKLVILANAIMGTDISYRDVKTQGIRRITPEALKLARKDDYVIKLIGEVRDGQVEVSPRLVPVSHPLNVGGTLNVATFETDVAKEITIVGRGAGTIETQSAILSDILSIYQCPR